MARILITGGSGYVGSHCAKALAMAGHEGIVFDSLLSGHREFVRSAMSQRSMQFLRRSGSMRSCISQLSPMSGNLSRRQAVITT
jgi:UDP-glucose 4-epimerase